MIKPKSAGHRQLPFGHRHDAICLFKAPDGGWDSKGAGGETLAAELRR
jgi:hypothetical protein